MPVLLRVGFILSAIACSLAPSLSTAQPRDVREEAARHFDQAEAYLRVEAYREAIREYEAAYALAPKPGFVFNIGIVYERMGDHTKALAQ